MELGEVDEELKVLAPAFYVPCEPLQLSVFLEYIISEGCTDLYESRRFWSRILYWTLQISVSSYSLPTIIGTSFSSHEQLCKCVHCFVEKRSSER